MLAEGAVEEVRQHRVSGGGGVGRARAPIAHAIGYREICAELDGQATRSQTEVALATATRKYARRQLTWMRRLEDAVIMDSRAVPSAELAHRIEIMARERHAVAPIPPSGGSV
jgi:tRNA dimethylallyltransferase